MISRNVLWAVNISIGFFFIGYSYNEASPLWEYYPCIFTESGINGVTPKQNDDKVLLAILVHTCIAAVTWIVIGTFSSFNRRRYMILLDILVILSSLLMIIPNFPVFILGRAIRGIITGISSVIVPLFMNEVLSPIEKISTLAFTQIFVAFGALWVYVFAILTPSISIPDEDSAEDYCYSIDGKYIPWRLQFTFPILFAMFQLFWFLFIFRTDSFHYGKLILDYWGE